MAEAVCSVLIRGVCVSSTVAGIFSFSFPGLLLTGLSFLGFKWKNVVDVQNYVEKGCMNIATKFYQNMEREMSFQNYLENPQFTNLFNSIPEIINKDLDNYLNNIPSTFIEKNLLNITKQTLSKMENNLFKHLNILVLGPTGVGKSTLINAILELEENNAAKTDPSKVTTKNFDEYTSNKRKGIRLIDSRGIELDPKNGIEKLYNETVKLVESKESENNPDKFIHCIWYCITGTRLQEPEKKFLEKISKIYTGSNLPIIVVYTQPSINKFIKAIENEVKLIDKKLPFLDVNAINMKIGDNHIIKPYNLEKLIEISREKISKAIKSNQACSIRKSILNYINNGIYDNKNAIVQKIKNNENFSYIYMNYNPELIKYPDNKITSKIFKKINNKKNIQVDLFIDNYIDQKIQSVMDEIDKFINDVYNQHDWIVKYFKVDVKKIKNNIYNNSKKILKIIINYEEIEQTINTIFNGFIHEKFKNKYDSAMNEKEKVSNKMNELISATLSKVLKKFINKERIIEDL